MTEAEFRRELKTGLSGAYLFYGEEAYLKDFYIGRARTAVLGADEAFADFNAYDIAADNTGALGELEEALLSLPMMGERVFIRYTVSLSALKNEVQEALCALLSGIDPAQTVCVVVPAPGSFDPGKPEKGKPSAIYKKFGAVCTPVDLTYTLRDLKAWMIRRLSRAGVTMGNDATEQMLERCGADMYLLSGELSKLAAYAGANGLSEITPEHVALVCFPSVEEDAFALANAIMQGDRPRALAVLSYHKKHDTGSKSEHSASAVLGKVSACICKMLAVSRLAAAGDGATEIAAKLHMHPYPVKLYLNAVQGMEPERLAAAVRRCREADALLKGTRLDYIALERLVCTLPVRRGRPLGGYRG